MLALDTHVLIDFLAGNLRPSEETAMARERWGISAIVLWELYDLANRGRIRMDLDSPALNRDLSYLQVWPITVNVCRALRLLDFRSDPADEIIAATSLAHDIPLLTRDARILASRVVPFAL